MMRDQKFERKQEINESKTPSKRLTNKEIFGENVIGSEEKGIEILSRLPDEKFQQIDFNARWPHQRDEKGAPTIFRTLAHFLSNPSHFDSKQEDNFSIIYEKLERLPTEIFSEIDFNARNKFSSAACCILYSATQDRPTLILKFLALSSEKLEKIDWEATIWSKELAELLIGLLFSSFKINKEFMRFREIEKLVANFSPRLLSILAKFIESRIPALQEFMPTKSYDYKIVQQYINFLIALKTEKRLEKSSESLKGLDEDEEEQKELKQKQSEMQTLVSLVNSLLTHPEDYLRECAYYHFAMMHPQYLEEYLPKITLSSPYFSDAQYELANRYFIQATHEESEISDDQRQTLLEKAFYHAILHYSMLKKKRENTAETYQLLRAILKNMLLGNADEETAPEEQKERLPSSQLKPKHSFIELPRATQDFFDKYADSIIPAPVMCILPTDSQNNFFKEIRILFKQEKQAAEIEKNKTEIAELKALVASLIGSVKTLESRVKTLENREPQPLPTPAASSPLASLSLLNSQAQSPEPPRPLVVSDHGA